MIFPFLRGLVPPQLAPATWFLLGINILVFLINMPQFMSSQNALDEFFEDTAFMKTQGSAFAQFVEEGGALHSPFLRRMGSRALLGDQRSQIMMGGYALRNREFMETAMDRDFKGDVLAVRQWKADLIELRAVQLMHPTYKWGLSAVRPSWINWISYQFAHSGFQHLLWNMIFLVLFAGFLEVSAGSSLVVLAYLGSGVAGAALFSALSGLTYSPLIGASGAVSGLMACIAVMHWRETVRFFFWLLPIPGYYGLRELPAWLIIIVYLVPDIAGQIGSVPDANGMAYSAHLGGAMFGALAGYAIRQGWLEKEDVGPASQPW